jgi:hypothetical protein
LGGGTSSSDKSESTNWRLAGMAFLGLAGSVLRFAAGDFAFDAEALGGGDAESERITAERDCYGSVQCI